MHLHLHLVYRGNVLTQFRIYEQAFYMFQKFVCLLRLLSLDIMGQSAANIFLFVVVNFNFVIVLEV